MIKELTRKQKDKLTIYCDKWLAIGLETAPANRQEAEKGIELAYAIAGKQKPKIVWCLSPLTSGLVRHCILSIKKIGVGDSVGASVRASVGDSVGASVRASVGDSVRASVGASVGASVRASVGDSVWASVWDSVRASVRASVGDSVWASVWASVRDSVRDSVGDSGYGQHDANWLGFYDYFSNELKLEKQTEKLKGLWIIAQNANWWLPHENICWISERHNVCKLKNGVIHCETGPAIAYPDGFEIYGLNGIRVPAWVVKTAEIDISIKQLLEVDNADIRREVLRKIGVGRLFWQGKEIDKLNDYTLINLGHLFLRGVDFYAPYLVMENPSVKGLWHCEGVHEDCKTVKQALTWRNGTDKPVLVLT